MVITDSGKSSLEYFQKAITSGLDDLVVNECKPRVPITVVSANYNNGEFLVPFIWSIINGSVLPTEIILVDDGSLDESRAIIQEIESRVPLISAIFLTENRGFANALNVGIAASRSKYIARIDPDDICGPFRFEEQSRILESGEVDLIGANALIFDSETSAFVSMTNFPVGSKNIAKRIRIGQHGVLHPTVTGKAEWFSKYPYSQTSVPAEDYEIFAKMCAGGARIDNIKNAHLYYRAHGSSASTNLRYSLIDKTYSLRDEIFHTKTSWFVKVRYFLFIYSYRKYLYQKSRTRRCCWAFIVVSAAPIRTFRRLLARS